MSEKMRLDVAVFERGYAETREKAKALIMAGSVYLNGQKNVEMFLEAEQKQNEKEKTKEQDR